MKGSIRKEYLEGRALFVYLPPSYGKGEKKFPVLYSHDGEEVNKLSEELIPKLEAAFEKEMLQEFIWIGIYSERRQHEYTPWPAPALVPQFEDFKGLGSEYISFLTNHLKTYVDEVYAAKTEPEYTWMMGYSLGGLISVYSIYETSVFGRIGCLCGSFWYEGMVQWVEEHKPLNKTAELFMYYGKTEGKGKKTIQCHAVSSAEAVIKRLKSQTEVLEVAFDEGGHHQYTADRYEKVLLWLAGAK